jgi:hypothetical protein
MDMNDERKSYLERKRIYQAVRYHTDEAHRQYQIDYELRRRREDPEYRARRNARELARYHRKKALKKALEENKENVPMDVR